MKLGIVTSSNFSELFWFIFITDRYFNFYLKLVLLSTQSALFLQITCSGFGCVLEHEFSGELQTQ